VQSALCSWLCAKGCAGVLPDNLAMRCMSLTVVTCCMSLTVVTCVLQVLRCSMGDLALPLSAAACGLHNLPLRPNLQLQVRLRAWGGGVQPAWVGVPLPPGEQQPLVAMQMRMALAPCYNLSAVFIASVVLLVAGSPQPAGWLFWILLTSEW